MKIYGTFLDRQGRKVGIEILTDGKAAPIHEIGGAASPLAFSAAPAVTATEAADPFDHVIRQSATLKLNARAFVPDLFSASCFDATVSVSRGGSVLFKGFVAPQTYNQMFVEAEDELEINCIDTLSALQYVRWRNAGAAGVDFDTLCADARNVTLLEIITQCAGVAGVTSVLYDGSRTLPDSEEGVFAGVAVNELLMLGDNEDETWTMLEALEEVMRYLGLRIIQDGDRWLVFDSATLKKGQNTQWSALMGSVTMKTEPKTVAISTANVDGTDAQVTVGETYNYIAVTCERSSVEDLVHSPLDEDSLTSPYAAPQKYLTEYYAHGEGETAFNNIVDLMNGSEPAWKDSARVDWFVRVRDNIRWRFTNTDGGDLMRRYCQPGQPQNALPDSMATQMNAALLSFGSVEASGDRTDNSPVPKLDMTDCLVISVNGNGEDTDAGAAPTAAQLKARAPLAEYTGAFSGGVYSPADDATTNYIVISGKLALVPLMADSFPSWSDRPVQYYDRYATNADGSYKYWHHTVPSRVNDDGRYYMRMWWQCPSPFGTPQGVRTKGLMPFTDKQCPQQYEFKYSAIGDGTDRVSKVAVIACMLVIGDKCVVESGTQGRPSDFRWRTFKERSQCKDDDEYYAQSFTIGFDPKIGDFLLGQEYPVQNNIDYTLGLDVEGTAIPIKRSDALQGRVRFIILGPVNTTWGEVTRRHPTWFRRTQWSTGCVPLLAHTSSIAVNDFEVKVVSDNGLLDTKEESDLIYASDTAGGFINKRDDLTMRINSGLTAQEAADLGMTTVPSLSTPVVTATGQPLLAIKCGDVTAKPEQLYVDAAWTEHHLPRVILEQTFADTGSTVSLFNLYTHPALPGRKLRVTALDRDLYEGTARLTLKESEL